MDKGCIVAVGTHQEMLKKNGYDWKYNNKEDFTDYIVKKSLEYNNHLKTNFIQIKEK